MEGKSGAVYSFEDFRLDPARKLLFSADEAVPITHKALQVLVLLVENSGRLVSKEELMRSVWQDSFVEDANLTQTISVLRKTLGENPNQHRFIVTEPGKGYRFVAPITKQDASSEAVEEKTVETDSPRSYRIVYVIGLVAIVLLFLVIGANQLRQTSEVSSVHPTSASEVKAIAVLPFHSIESNDESELLGIGMADAVITRLSQLKSIVVRQTRTIVHSSGATPDAIRIGREINVDAVLEGSIQKADGRIRVSVRLYRVDDGALLWAESFDERDSDIFALQDSISEKVANSLSLQLNPDEREKLKRRYTENLEAYQLYNKGRYFWNNRSSEDLRKSIGFYEQAIAIDGNYALAYSGLAESYVLLHLFSPNQDKEAFLKAKQAAVRALSLDENLVGARTALAMYKAQADWDWEGADSEFRRAVATNPSYATAHQTYGEFLGFMGRTEESITQIEKAFELDPLSLSTNTARAFPYMVAGRFDESIEKLKPALEMQPNFPMARFYLGRSYEGKGMYKQSIAEYQRAIQNSGGSTFFVSASIRALVKGGQRREGEKRLEELLRASESQPISTYVLARAYASLGDREKALENLEQAFNERDGLMHVIKVDPNFEDVRSEGRFQAILKKMRLE